MCITLSFKLFSSFTVTVIGVLSNALVGEKEYQRIASRPFALRPTLIICTASGSGEWWRRAIRPWWRTDTWLDSPKTWSWTWTWWWNLSNIPWLTPNDRGRSVRKQSRDDSKIRVKSQSKMSEWKGSALSCAVYLGALSCEQAFRSHDRNAVYLGALSCEQAFRSHNRNTGCRA
jgi:hypothetical protein